MVEECCDLPIGVFDSGVGGLTVLNALRQALPDESLLYLGDTARVPYGTKSAESVTRYAAQAAAALINRKIKLLVIACNTASAVAVEPLQTIFPNIPVVGVIDPGAKACSLQTQTGSVGVIATEGTVTNGAYQQAISRIMPQAKVHSQPCSMFVALAEEGWHSGELVEQIVSRCLEPLLQSHQQEAPIDTLVLGCTHFPVLKDAISNICGDEIAIVDSATTTANEVAALLDKHQIAAVKKRSVVNFLVTDGPERFVRVASHFFDEDIDLGSVELIDLN